MRGSRHLALAALVVPALLACGGSEGKQEAATPGSERAAAGAPFSVKVCSGEGLGGSCKTFTQSNTRDLSDLSKVSYWDRVFTPIGGTIQSIELGDGAWVALFAEKDFKGQAVYVGWNQTRYDSLSNVSLANGGTIDFNKKAQSMAIFVRGETPSTSKKVTMVATGWTTTNGKASEKKMYVCADGLRSDNYGWPLIANRDRVGDRTGPWGSWETFDMYSVGYGVPKEYTLFALQASWGAGYAGGQPVTSKFVAAEWQKDKTAPLYARSDEIGPWEVFRLDPTKSGENWQKATFTSITNNAKPYWARQLDQPNEASQERLKVPYENNLVVSRNDTNQFWIQDVTTTRQAQPLLIHPYTADPSAHFFNGKMYVYPSHDADIWNGDFLMTDYHVFSMTTPTSQVIDHGAVVTVGEGAAAWAKEKMWAPDAAYRDGKYYLFFPARHDEPALGHAEGINRIGVAVSNTPEGPFGPVPISGTSAMPNGYIERSFSMDPTVLADGNDYYLYTGGVAGGQLECWSPVWGPPGMPNEEKRVVDWTFSNANCNEYADPGKYPVLRGPVVAKLNPDMASLVEVPQPIGLYKSDGSGPVTDPAMTYFEAPFVVTKVLQTREGPKKYYFLTYSTGESGNIWVAWATQPEGDLMGFDENGHAKMGFRVLDNGNILPGPRCGWTTHHSVVHTEPTPDPNDVDWGDKWYVFYHDAQLAPDAPTPVSECIGAVAQIDKRTIMFKEIAFPPEYPAGTW